jgi:hypothetical protein
MERVALARLVNKEIRGLAKRLDVGEESHAYAWMCACGCFTIVNATLVEFDASAEQIFAPGHPLDEERATAAQAYERVSDPSAITRRVDENKRRELTRDLTRRLERQVMTNGT